VFHDKCATLSENVPQVNLHW